MFFYAVTPCSDGVRPCCLHLHNPEGRYVNFHHRENQPVASVWIDQFSARKRQFRKFYLQSNCFLSREDTLKCLSQPKGKGKVAPVLFLTEHHDMKAYWGVEV